MRPPESLPVERAYHAARLRVRLGPETARRILACLDLGMEICDEVNHNGPRCPRCHPPVRPLQFIALYGVSPETLNRVLEQSR